MCGNGHGTYSWLPPFLCRYLRSLARVVQKAFEEYAIGLPLKVIPTNAEGPTFLTVWRWTQLLEQPRIRSKLEVEASRPVLVPTGGRPYAQRTLALAECVVGRYSQLSATLIQWVSLLLRPRYHRLNT